MMGYPTARNGNGAHAVFEYDGLVVVAAPNGDGAWDLYLQREDRAMSWPEIEMAWRATDQALCGYKRNRDFVRSDDDRQVHLSDNASMTAAPSEAIGAERLAVEPVDDQERERRVRRAASMAWASDHGRGVKRELVTSPTVPRVLEKVVEAPPFDEAYEFFWGALEQSVDDDSGERPGKSEATSLELHTQRTVAESILLQSFLSVRRDDEGAERRRRSVGIGTPGGGTRKAAYFLEVIGQATPELVGQELRGANPAFDDDSGLDPLEWNMVAYRLGGLAALEALVQMGFAVEDWKRLIDGAVTLLIAESC